MKTKHLLFKSLLMTIFILSCCSKVLALDYNTVIQSIEVIQSDAITTNQFTLNITQKGVNSGGTSYATTLTMVLESDDRTLEGLYSTLSNSTNKIKEAELIYGSNIRALNTATSKFLINKESDGHYSIGDLLSSTDCQLHFKQISPSNTTTYNYFYSYAYDSGTSGKATTLSPFTFEFTPKYAIAPSALNVSAKTATSATISWTSSESAWQYVCLPASTTLTEALWNSSAVNTDSKTVNLTELTPATGYKFYVISKNASGTSVITSTEFTTECEIISTLPWNYGFENATNGQTPTCWTEVLSNTSGWFRAISGTSYRHTGSLAARLYGGTSTSTVTAVFPEFEKSINNLEVAFWYKAKESYYDDWSESDIIYGHPQFGYITDVEDASTFVAVGEPLVQSGSYVFVEGLTVSGAPNGARFALRYTGGTSSDYLYIDDITVREKPACSKPTEVTAGSETAEGATITWSANGMDSWKLQVSEGDDASWGEETAVTANSKVLTGLKANTLYYVRVKADCGSDVSEWSDYVSFTTLCGTIIVSASSSWSIDFQGLEDNVIPECWDNSASTTSAVWGAEYIWGTSSRSGNTYLRMDNSQLDGGTALINTPEIAIPDDGKTYELTFGYCNVTAATDLFVKIAADGGDFVQKGAYSPAPSGVASYPGEFVTATISLADYSGQTIKVQFFTNPTSGTSYGAGAMFIDNISVHKMVTCFAPTALAAGDLTANSALISWTAGAGENAWQLQFRADGGDWSAEQTVNETAQYTLTGLDASTVYYVRVKSYCDAEEQSEWSEIISFTTLCAATTMPFNEEFSSGTELPSCWEATPAVGNSKWGAYEKSGAYSVQLRTGSAGSAELRMPAISLTEDAILRFEWKNADGINVNLFISTDGGTTKTMIPNDLSGIHADWTTKTFDLSAYTGQTVLIYFLSNFSTMNQYAYLDDVAVIARPCNMILNIQATPVTGGATVSWSGNVKKLQYKTGSDEWTSVSISSEEYAGPKSISGLTPARSYQVRLLPACLEEAEENWTSPVFFTSLATETVPYYNNFETETAGEVPFNWSRVSTSEFPQVVYDAYAYHENFGEKGNSIKFSGLNDQIIVLPEFDAAFASLYIAFHYRNRDCAMEIGYVEADGATFHALDALPNQTGYGEFPYEKEFTGISENASKIAIRYSGATGANSVAYIDNVSVNVISCGKPDNLAASDITATGAHISWSASASALETGYQYILQEWSEEDPNWENAVAVESSVKELNPAGLKANTHYEFYLRSYCSESDQSTPVKIEFTTTMLDEVFEDEIGATNNETRLQALEGQTINITLKRPLLRNGYYSTLTVPFSLSSSQLIAADCPLRGFNIYEFESSKLVNGNISIYLAQVSSIEAGKPYFVRYTGTPNDEALTPLRFQNVLIELSEPYKIDGDNCAINANFNPFNLTAGDESTLVLSTDNSFHWAATDDVLKGFRAFIQVPEYSSFVTPIHNGAAVRIREKDDDLPTGMETVLTDKTQSTKRIENGVLYLIHKGKKYNVQGQVVK